MEKHGCGPGRLRLTEREQEALNPAVCCIIFLLLAQARNVRGSRRLLLLLHLFPARGFGAVDAHLHAEMSTTFVRGEDAPLPVRWTRQYMRAN
jgi:hypothetical protein